MKKLRNLLFSIYFWITLIGYLASICLIFILPYNFITLLCSVIAVFSFVIGFIINYVIKEQYEYLLSKTRHKYLLKPDVRSDEDKYFKDFLTTGAKLPVTVDLRNKFPPIWDQGNLGSCQSFAINAIDAFIKKYTFTPSHLFTYYNARKLEGTTNSDSGATISDTCKALASYGTCDSAVWAYDISKFDVQPPQAAYDNAKAKKDNITDFYRISSVNEMKQALAAGHVPYIGIYVYESFETPACLKSGVIPAPSGKLLGGHALDVVGYSDDPKARCFQSKGYFWIRNSWGDDVGIKGYFKCSYENLVKLLVDAWIIVK